MQRIRLSDSLELSRIVYGMWRIGDDPDTSPGHIQAKIETCLEQGITSIDQPIQCGAGNSRVHHRVRAVDQQQVDVV